MKLNGLFVLGAVALASGCGMMGGAKSGSSSGKARPADVKAARDAKDVQKLSDICMNKTPSINDGVRTDACDYGINVLAANKDTAMLTKICNGKDPGQPYAEWKRAFRACEAIRPKPKDDGKKWVKRPSKPQPTKTAEPSSSNRIIEIKLENKCSRTIAYCRKGNGGGGPSSVNSSATARINVNDGDKIMLESCSGKVIHTVSQASHDKTITLCK